MSQLVTICSSFSSDIYVVTGNEGDVSANTDSEIHIYRVGHKKGTNICSRIVRYTYTQLRISYELLKLRGKVLSWIFFIGGEGLLFPILTVKFLRRDVVMAIAGSGPKVTRVQNDPLSKGLWLLSEINRALSDRIIVYTPRLIEEYNLERHRGKISIADHHFVNFDVPMVQKALDERRNLVGYIGRLDEAKGVPNFLEAIPWLIERESKINFVIGGDGELKSEVERFLKREDLNSRVEFVNWIPHDSLPNYLNELKLLVLPSYTEGLPSIILEAMACGTPVLATPVGAIPDVIKDGETGFIMEDNSPQCIARNIVRALNHPNPEEIIINAYALINREYTYEATVNSYRPILDNMKQKHE